MNPELETVFFEREGRLDKLLSRALPYSRSILQKLIKEGAVQVDGEIVCDKSYSCSGDEKVTVEISEEAFSDRIKPEDGPLEMLYEDEFLLAVNKPAGMIVHPTGGVKAGTLVNRLLYHYPELEKVGGAQRSGLVHRLDRGTSGVVLIARSNKILAELQQQFKDKAVKKTYRAVLGGELADSRLRIEVPIARHPHNPLLRRAAAAGKKAVTKLQVAGRGRGLTSVWCYPLTGRTHQIRIHCKYINHPVLGDKKYGGKKAERLMLHAEKISFKHPLTDKIIKVETEPPREVLERWQKQV
ncbi:MAG: RluA family pseudouridine synthase [bacterium]